MCLAYWGICVYMWVCLCVRERDYLFLAQNWKLQLESLPSSAIITEWALISACESAIRHSGCSGRRAVPPMECWLYIFIVSHIPPWFVCGDGTLTPLSSTELLTVSCAWHTTTITCTVLYSRVGMYSVSVVNRSLKGTPFCSGHPRILHMLPATCA